MSPSFEWATAPVIVGKSLGTLIVCRWFEFWGWCGDMLVGSGVADEEVRSAVMRMMSISRTFESIGRIFERISRTFEMNLSLVRLEDKKTVVSIDPYVDSLNFSI